VKFSDAAHVPSLATSGVYDRPTLTDMKTPLTPTGNTQAR